MADKQPKRPRDLNQWAKRMVDIATGDAEDVAPVADDRKDPAAVSRGRLGGKKGGAARAAALTPEERSASALKAVRARWDRRS